MTIAGETQAMPAAVVEDETHYVRDFVSTVSQRVVGLYETTKSASPASIKGGMEQLERRVEPYSEPVLSKLKQTTDPLVDCLDTKISDLVPQARAVEGSVKDTVKDTVTKVNETWIKPSEEFVKTQKVAAQGYVTATEEYLVEKRKAVYDGVNDRVLKPSYEKVVAPTGDYVEAIREQVAVAAKQRTEYVSDVYHTVLARADEAVEHILPEDNNNNNTVEKVVEKAVPKEVAEAVVGDDDKKPLGPDALTRKIASRLRRRAHGAASYGTDRARELVHADHLLSYAKDTVRCSETMLSRAIDRVASYVPTPEAADAALSSIIARLPKRLQHPAQRVAHTVVAPPLVWTLVRLSAVFVFLRGCVATPAHMPATKPTGAAEHKVVAEQPPSPTKHDANEDEDEDDDLMMDDTTNHMTSSEVMVSSAMSHPTMTSSVATVKSLDDTQ